MDAQPPILADIVRYVCEESLMFADERSPFQAKAYYPKQTPVCVIVGENASGKSVFFQVMAGVARREHKLLPVTISIRERTGAGSHEMGGMRRTMMFGDESEQSTGATSYNVIQSGFHNVSKPDTPAMLLLDEPEIGLSDGYARALGHYIGRQALAAPPSCAGVVVVTHSRSLVDSLCMMAGISPLFVNLNPDPVPLLDWLEKDELRSIDDLKALREKAIERRRIVANLLNNKDA
jgi:ABC-type uncharacterized transport system ATPase subunit